MGPAVPKVASFKVSFNPSLLDFAKTSLHSVAAVRIRQDQVSSWALRGTCYILLRSRDFAVGTDHSFTAIKIATAVGATDDAAVSGDATNDGVGTTSVIGAVSFNSAAVIVRDANSTSND